MCEFVFIEIGCFDVWDVLIFYLVVGEVFICVVVMGICGFDVYGYIGENGCCYFG